MSNHTVGPWWIDDRRPKGGDLQIQAAHRGPGSSYCVAHLNPWEAPDANARLIAAAPEMLAALECEQALDRPIAADGYAVLECHGWNRDDCEETATNFVRRLRLNAIAKATQR